MKQWIITLFLLGFCFFMGCAMPMTAADFQKKRDDALLLDKAHFKKSISIKDDALETNATISTYNGYRIEYRFPLVPVRDPYDSYLRGFINKKTGEKLCQVYTSINYRDTGWRMYRGVNYETPAGPEYAVLTIIDRTVNCDVPSYSYGMCEYSEDMGFNVNLSLLRKLALNYDPSNNTFWRFKQKSHKGPDQLFEIPLSEIAAFIEVMDEYKIRE